MKRETYLKLDPRTKLFLMLIINMSAFSGSQLYIMVIIAMIPLVLLIFSGKLKASFYYFIGYIAAALSQELLVPITHGAANIIVVMLSGLIYRMMPGAVMGYYLVVTTKVSEFIASMERMNISKKIVIPLSVMFRFFPTIGEEAMAIDDAMKMRGIFFGSKKFFENPGSMIEYRIIPLLMTTVKIGDELSAASLTRGLGSPEKRTNICKIGFGIMDFILIIIGTLAFAGLIIS